MGMDGFHRPLHAFIFQQLQTVGKAVPPGYHVSQSAHWPEGTDFSDPTFEALDVGSKQHGDGAICSGANLSRYEQEELCAKQLGASELIGIGSSGCESYVCSC